MIPSPRSVQWIRLGFGVATIAVITAAAAVPASPMGVDVAKPRFFWVLGHPERGQVQSAYQVFVSTDPQAAAGDIWDSGKVASAKSVQIAFAGKALESGRTYFWKARTWDREGRESPWSAVARFDTGLYSKSDWQS
ncbi:MAG: alpha-L-rhamnosidase [Candidatus Aminicenantes bacterium]|nr:alpha-L-rhamnosidase [Candidatus Aminicenantes bacterium]